MDAKLKSALVVGCLLCAAVPWATAVTIDHSAIAGVTNVPQTVMDRVGLLRWFFSHAIQASSNPLVGASWTNIAGNIGATPPLNSYTAGGGGVTKGFYRAAVQQ